MKKIFAVLSVFVLIFAACEDGEVNSDFFGVWTAKYGTGGVLSLNIVSDNTWTLTFTEPWQDLYNGKWSGSGNTIKLLDSFGFSSSGSATLSDGKLILNQDLSTNFGRPVTSTLTKSGSSEGTKKITTLKIKNESSKTIADVLWSNVSFKDDSKGTNADIIGTWACNYEATAKHSAGEIEFEIGQSPYSNYDGSWSLLCRDSDGTRVTANGLLSRKGINITIVSTGHDVNGSASLSATRLIITISGSTGNSNLTNRIGDIYELTRIGESFKPGTNVTKDVEAGSGYIFFKVGTSSYRTKDLVVVEKDKEAEFTFNDYTFVVNVNSPDNTTVTLGSL